MSIDEVMERTIEYGLMMRTATISESRALNTSIRAAVEQHVAEAVAKETERLRGALLTLANAADDVGVQFFDMEDPPISVAQMESATLAARAAIEQHVAEAVAREREELLDLVDSYAKDNADLKDAIRARADNEVTT